MDTGTGSGLVPEGGKMEDFIGYCPVTNRMLTWALVAQIRPEEPLEAVGREYARASEMRCACHNAPVIHVNMVDKLEKRGREWYWIGAGP